LAEEGAVKILAALTGAMLLLAGASPGDDWTRFRGPNGSGVSEATGLPTEFGPAKNLVWKTTVPFGRSSPVVAGNLIFLTATEGEKLITLALDRKSGRIRWRREIVRPRAMAIYKANDGASPTPVADRKNVYAFFPELGLVSYTRDGKERWRLPLGPFDSFYGLSSSPVLSGNTLLMLCDARKDQFLVAVDAGSGKVRWRVARPEVKYESHTTPVIYEPANGPAQVVVLGAKRVDAYALSTGERLWWITGLAYLPIGSPVVAGGTLVVSTFGSDEPMGPPFETFLKFDTDGDKRLTREEMRSEKEMYEFFGQVDTNSDGFVDREEWEDLRRGAVGVYGLVGVKLGGGGDLTQSAVLWREKKTYPSMPTPLIYGDVLYVVKTGGIIASLNPHTGENYKVDRSKEALDEYYASPVAADGKIFFVNENGKVTVARAGAKWEILAVNDLGEETHTTPAIAGGRIFIRTHKALYAFGTK
jgi:outer membrane protein assembly factor BamB